MTVPSADLLFRALHVQGEPPLRLLPPAAAGILSSLDTPPRLAAHLRAVHDVAVELTGWVRERHPGLAFDHDAVHFGAATHDVGKIRHPGELTGPGSEHEQAGRDLLLEYGFPPQLARFAATHAGWDAPTVTIEDLLVAAADKVWKDKRVPGLEERLARTLAAAAGREPWEEFLALDDLLTRIGADAAGRLVFQSAFPT
ncbi:HD domain-containing protein [Streptomyces sp. NPDC003691]